MDKYIQSFLSGQSVLSMLAFLVTLLMFSFPAQARETISDRQLLIIIGFDKQINATASTFGDIGKGNPKLASAWQEATHRTFRGPEMIKAMEGRIRGVLTQDEKAQVAQFYRSPLGQKILDLEQASIGPEAEAKTVAMTPQLKKEGAANPERVTMFKSITQSMKAIELGTEFAINMNINFVMGMVAVKRGAIIPSYEDLAQKIESSRPQIRSQLQEAVDVGMLFTYRDLSNAEIRIYLDFLLTPVSRKLNKKLIAGYFGILGDKGYKFGKILQGVLGRKAI